MHQEKNSVIINLLISNTNRSYPLNLSPKPSFNNIKLLWWLGLANVCWLIKMFVFNRCSPDKELSQSRYRKAEALGNHCGPELPEEQLPLVLVTLCSNYVLYMSFSQPDSKNPEVRNVLWIIPA